MARFTSQASPAGLGKAFERDYDTARDGIADVTYVTRATSRTFASYHHGGRLLPFHMRRQGALMALDACIEYAEKELKDVISACSIPFARLVPARAKKILVAGLTSRA